MSEFQKNNEKKLEPITVSFGDVILSSYGKKHVVIDMDPKNGNCGIASISTDEHGSISLRVLGTAIRSDVFEKTSEVFSLEQIIEGLKKDNFHGPYWGNSNLEEEIIKNSKKGSVKLK